MQYWTNCVPSFVYEMCTADERPNNALLTNASGLQLRCAHRAAKRER